ncbi:Superfamily I DNA and RNA helicase [Edwardsiella anguillarum]|uniref:DEAD/DEAH box helicase n=1 Tax=Edwardsiella TaxID=635 RepID=UPI00045D4E2E|nr:DEAD/DEAH box helicase [Edwardsiella anguillarum]GAJ65926.1 AAA domain protein [Edwardsiella piscicida]RFT03537.1 helicase [Edwardsiella anguillarum]BET81483.1 Superfamily I DNA and RNA helicase [Edwardsiella anguillarum]BET84910.1 Superfamily I DNA and RNA helicase [Edwardsiella anguillarum]BET88275.1 Superfamily I DNA and RNA helicase [Edwardsiella anguillarum]
MVTICVDGENKTNKISDWTLWSGYDNREIMLTCHFRSGKKYTRPLSVCQITPTSTLHNVFLERKGFAITSRAERVVLYGNKYAVVYYSGNEKPYIMKTAGINFQTCSNFTEHAVFDYFCRIAEERISDARGNDRSIAENVLRQIKRIVPHPDTALHAYCSGQSKERDFSESLIFPFGLNESQLLAVERAFSSQLSVIEGPPGTGKTQTILNIVANILIQNKTVAILSNNNTAVSNVYEKMDKQGLGYLIARLGSSENRQHFFSMPSLIPEENLLDTPPIHVIDDVFQQVKKHLNAINQVALLKAEIDELSVEHKYLQQWQGENHLAEESFARSYRLSSRKTADLMAYIHYLSGRRIGLKNRIDLLLNFRILRIKPLNDQEKRLAIFTSLQLSFYEKAIQEKQGSLDKYNEILAASDFNNLLDQLTSLSMIYLKWCLQKSIPPEKSFAAETYRDHFDRFIKRFPIIGSSTHSIINSIGKGAILDYVIIDEASQQDIVPGILGLGCARNVIVVGDRKQLPHVPIVSSSTPPAEYYDCVKNSLLDSICMLFRETTPITLLKEHYRCHPKIIQFCNKQFYDNTLIPLTTDSGESSLSLVITAKGNHTRNFSNFRELESIEGHYWDEKSSRGYIAPYNAQINLAETVLPVDFVKSTVHKFQGRECDEIVFSTVLDKKCSSQQSRNIMFVDDPNLVNVAVSRARNKFTLVTGDGVFESHSTHIAALIRHIKYYANDEDIFESPVISAFDLLYSEYDKSLERLNIQLDPDDSCFKSEQIVASLLRDKLSLDSYRSMMFHSQIALNQLVSLELGEFSPRELSFMHNRASCDFVIYYKVGKTPLGVIEVDGGYHLESSQIERDELKNSILKKCNLPLLRLCTTDSNIEGKLGTFLSGLLH